MEQLGKGHTMRVFDDGCDADFGQLAAGDIEGLKPAIVTGFLCNDAAIAVANQLAPLGTPILISDARSIRLIKDRYRENWNLWRLAPGDDYPVETAASAIIELWKDSPFAIVDDGTIYGRSFTDQLRLKLSEAGLNPQFSDSFRAAQSTQAGLLRRLERSGVTAAFIASASIEDLTTIATDIKAFDINLDLMTTEALASLPYLNGADDFPIGTKVIASPELEIDQLSETLTEKELEADRLFYIGYASVEIALQALSSTQEETTKNLGSKTFNTILGNVSFSENGAANYNPYRLLIWNGTTLTTHQSNIGTQ